MLTQTNHRETYRFVPSTSTPVSPERVAELLKAEWELFTKQTGKSAEESRRALKSLPLGVTSSFQHWDPYPISKAHGEIQELATIDISHPGALSAHNGDWIWVPVLEA